MGTTNLRRTLGKFLLVQLLFVIGLLAFHIGSFAVLLKGGIVLPANQAEIELADTKEGLMNGTLAWQDILSAFNFKVMDKEGRVLYNDIPGRFENLVAEAEAEGYARNLRIMAPVVVHYIEGKNQNVVLWSTVAAQFVDKDLRRLLPYVEGAQLLAFMGTWMLGFMVLLNRFAKPIQKDLDALVAVNDEITRGNLDFELPQSHFREIQDVLHSIAQMKTALAQALQAEWHAKQSLTESLQSITHDVRTPLTLIQGNLELLRETGLSAQQLAYLGHAQNGVTRFYDYLEELALLAEGTHPPEETGKLTPALLAHWVTLAESIANGKQISVETQLQVQPDISLDPLAFTKAFQNVVQNAVDHAPKGSRLFITMQPTAFGYAVVVEDEGPGFPEKALQQGLQSGFTTRGEDPAHRGLGLHIALQMMQQNKGTIFLENKTEGGAKVTLALFRYSTDLKTGPQ